MQARHCTHHAATAPGGRWLRPARFAAQTRRRAAWVLSPNRPHPSSQPSSREEAADEEGPSTSSPSTAGEAEPLGVPPHKLPRHVAVIMDGNSRWAAQKGLPAAAGHQRGVEALRSAVKCCKEWGIQCLTVYAFSAENWQRQPEEVAFLLALFERVLRRELPALRAQGVRMRFIGEQAMLPPSLRREIARAEVETGDNCSVHLTVAMSYSGRQDITAAVQDIAHAVAQGQLLPSQITPALIASHLSTRQLPEALQEPDLIVRTSGEQRLSNFLLWESAYAELYFAEACWPEFGAAEFAAAVRDYAGRERRFGGRR